MSQTDHSSLTIEFDVELGDENTLALPCRCSHYVALQDPAQLPAVVDYARSHQLQLYPLSGGNNVLLPRQLHGLVVHINHRGMVLIDQCDDQVSLKVQAGEPWHELVVHCSGQGFYGLENLALIPGRVGAAPIQNIGAYGVEVGQLIESVEVFDCQSMTWDTLTASQCQFGYRDSIFKQQPGRFIVTAVQFRLSRVPRMQLGYADVAQQVGAEPTPQKLLQTIISIRQAKLPDPHQWPNAGSFFKNPIVSAQTCQTLQQKYPQLPHYLQPDGQYKLAAGWLIEQAGWKGKRLGKVGMYERQALVLVNYADADLDDVRATYQQVQADVAQRFGVLLEPEPVQFGSEFTHLSQTDDLSVLTE